MVLTSDSSFARHLVNCMVCIGVGEVESVGSLSSAVLSLRDHVIDIVVAEIHADRTDGLMLPSILKELNSTGLLAYTPHIIWTCGQQEYRRPARPPQDAEEKLGGMGAKNIICRTSLTSHARLARLVDIHVEIAWESCIECLCPVVEYLSDLPISSSQAQSSAGLPTYDDVLIALTSTEGLRLVYQPQYELPSKIVRGAEALIRWHHPRYGEIPPSVFIPMVNQLGLDFLLFSFVEKGVIETLVALDKAGVEIPIAVNASANTICAPGLATSLAHKMRHAGLPPNRLKVELTEDMSSDSELSVSAAIMALRMKGFLVSMDDFGAGSATMARLSQITFDELKIDGALVRTLGQSSASREIISLIVALAKLLDLKLVIEGVEDEATINLLCELGCKIGQGYGLSRPLEFHEFMCVAKSSLCKNCLDKESAVIGRDSLRSK
ncbi:EAL domain-containing protein [Pseudomonas aeruginosa]|nr:EAL domain-containing protein [Pseudomonas aeruginosa]MBW6292880.1 EAL domain-containing protein [Pseudomonas aeruginosa]